MNIRNATTKLITITMAMAAMAVIESGWTPGGVFASGPTAAEIFPQRSVIATIPPIGIVPGQMLRFSVVNPNTSEDTEPVRAQVLLYDAQGNVLKRSQEVYVPFGQFRSFDFSRDELPAAGERDTGRLQVRGEITFWFIDNPEQIAPDQFPAAMELVDKSTGETIQSRWYIGYVKVSPTG
jgi:hypothetical protein